MGRMVCDELTLTTDDGEMPTWVHRPGIAGAWPVVLLLMDAPSIRPALHDMASRLASAGYYVMMPYLYYRSGPYREFGQSDEDMHARREYMTTVNPANAIVDATALLAHAAGDPAASDGPYGAVGYCMSGGLTLTLAKHDPGRMAAAASIHGAWLVRDTADSPHLGADTMNAECYFGWCDNDPTAPAAARDTLTAALDGAGVEYTLDWYTEAEHGYAPAGARYNRAASEQHWERIHDLFHRRLR